MTTRPRQLDPEIARRLVEGHVDVLSGESERLDAFYENFTCLRCHGQLDRRYDPRVAFSAPDALLPRPLLFCNNCGFEIEPHTGVVSETGNASKIPFERVPIVGQD